jgi:hypothetical protein
LPFVRNGSLQSCFFREAIKRKRSPIIAWKPFDVLGESTTDLLIEEAE